MEKYWKTLCYVKKLKWLQFKTYHFCDYANANNIQLNSIVRKLRRVKTISIVIRYTCIFFVYKIPQNFLLLSNGKNIKILPLEIKNLWDWSRKFILNLIKIWNQLNLVIKLFNYYGASGNFGLLLIFFFVPCLYIDIQLTELISSFLMW